MKHAVEETYPPHYAAFVRFLLRTHTNADVQFEYHVKERGNMTLVRTEIKFAVELLA